MAIDGRDDDAWVGLFMPNVRVGRSTTGRDALRAYIKPLLRSFRRSMHQIVGHRVDLTPTTAIVPRGRRTAAPSTRSTTTGS